jgi:deoxyadenosine/deoxycytidine kinase
MTFPYDFIAIEGNIGAGKTTLCKLLAERYSCALVLEQFTDNPFLPYFYEHPERYGFPVELFFMTERHKQLQEHFAEPNLFEAFTISDYYFVKTLLFAKNNLNEEEFRLFQRLFGILNASFPNPGLLVYLHRPIPVLMNQINKRGRKMEQYITPEYLTEIQKAYFSFFKDEKHTPVVVLELDEANFLEDESILEQIIQVLSQEYELGVHYVSIGVKG